MTPTILIAAAAYYLTGVVLFWISQWYDESEITIGDIIFGVFVAGLLTPAVIYHFLRDRGIMKYTLICRKNQAK